MTDPSTATQKILIQEIVVSGLEDDYHALILRKPVLVESGQRYWVEQSELVVEDDVVGQRRFVGDLETRCFRR